MENIIIYLSIGFLIYLCEKISEKYCWIFFPEAETIVGGFLALFGAFLSFPFHLVDFLVAKLIKYRSNKVKQQAKLKEEQAQIERTARWRIKEKELEEQKLAEQAKLKAEQHEKLEAEQRERQAKLEAEQLNRDLQKIEQLKKNYSAALVKSNYHRSITDIFSFSDQETRTKAYVYTRKQEIYITNATQRELDLPFRKRDKLVYHVNPSCSYALKDYEIDGQLIARNSGVIVGEYHTLLSPCKMCSDQITKEMQTEKNAYNNSITSYTSYKRTSYCSRCGGSGYLSEYSHVSGGVCFKCEGSGKN